MLWTNFSGGGLVKQFLIFFSYAGDSVLHFALGNVFMLPDHS